MLYLGLHLKSSFVSCFHVQSWRECRKSRSSHFDLAGLAAVANRSLAQLRGGNSAPATRLSQSDFRNSTRSAFCAAVRFNANSWL